MSRDVCLQALPTLFSTAAKKAVREGLGTRLQILCLACISNTVVVFKAVPQTEGVCAVPNLVLIYRASSICSVCILCTVMCVYDEVG